MSQKRQASRASLAPRQSRQVGRAPQMGGTPQMGYADFGVHNPYAHIASALQSVGNDMVGVAFKKQELANREAQLEDNLALKDLQLELDAARTKFSNTGAQDQLNSFAPENVVNFLEGTSPLFDKDWKHSDTAAKVALMKKEFDLQTQGHFEALYLKARSDKALNYTEKSIGDLVASVNAAPSQWLNEAPLIREDLYTAAREVAMSFGAVNTKATENFINRSIDQYVLERLYTDPSTMQVGKMAIHEEGGYEKFFKPLFNDPAKSMAAYNSFQQMVKADATAAKTSIGNLPFTGSTTAPVNIEREVSAHREAIELLQKTGQTPDAKTLEKLRSHEEFINSSAAGLDAGRREVLKGLYSERHPTSLSDYAKEPNIIPDLKKQLAEIDLEFEQIGLRGGSVYEEAMLRNKRATVYQALETMKQAAEEPDFNESLSLVTGLMETLGGPPLEEHHIKTLMSNLKGHEISQKEIAMAPHVAATQAAIESGAKGKVFQTTADTGYAHALNANAVPQYIQAVTKDRHYGNLASFYMGDRQLRTLLLTPDLAKKALSEIPDYKDGVMGDTITANNYRTFAQTNRHIDGFVNRLALIARAGSSDGQLGGGALIQAEIEAAKKLGDVLLASKVSDGTFRARDVVSIIKSLNEDMDEGRLGPRVAWTTTGVKTNYILLSKFSYSHEDMTAIEAGLSAYPLLALKTPSDGRDLKDIGGAMHWTKEFFGETISLAGSDWLEGQKLMAATSKLEMRSYNGKVAAYFRERDGSLSRIQGSEIAEDDLKEMGKWVLERRAEKKIREPDYFSARPRVFNPLSGELATTPEGIDPKNKDSSKALVNEFRALGK